MAKIQFKRKIETVRYLHDKGQIAFTGFKVPKIKTSHCDMNAFRLHPRYGAYANSCMFTAMINSAVKKLLGDYVKLEKKLPDNVTIDTTGFLAVITIEL
jgi:hypothetical protein